MNTGKWGQLKKTVQWVLTVFCVAYIAAFFWGNRSDLGIILNFRLTSLLFILLLYVIYYLLHSWRIHIVVEKCSGSSIPIFPWFKLFVFGRFLNCIFPQAGNAYRSIQLKNNYQISYTHYISSFFSFAWMDTCFNFLLAAIVIASTDAHLSFGGVNVLAALLVVAFLCGVIPLLFFKICRLVELRLSRTFWIHAKLSEVFGITVKNVGDHTYLLKFLTLGFFVFVHTCFIFYICLTTLGVHVHWSQLALFCALFKVSTYLNITPGNLGIRELAYGVLSNEMGMGMAEGIIVSAILRIFGYIVIVALGLLLGGIDLLRSRETYFVRRDEE